MAEHFRIKPLAERNWLAMLLALVLLGLCLIVIAAIWQMITTGNADWYWWMVLGAMVLACVSAVLALITGDTEYFLLAVLIQWQR